MSYIPSRMKEKAMVVPTTASVGTSDLEDMMAVC